MKLKDFIDKVLEITGYSINIKFSAAAITVSWHCDDGCDYDTVYLNDTAEVFTPCGDEYITESLDMIAALVKEAFPLIDIEGLEGHYSFARYEGIWYFVDENIIISYNQKGMHFMSEFTKDKLSKEIIFQVSAAMDMLENNKVIREIAAAANARF